MVADTGGPGISLTTCGTSWLRPFPISLLGAIRGVGQLPSSSQKGAY